MAQLKNIPASDSYVDQVAQRFGAMLRSRIGDLPEPPVQVPEHALRLVGYLVETLAGFARGAILAPLYQLARRAEVEPRLLREVATAGPSPQPHWLGGSIASRGGAPSPLVDTFAADLLRRLGAELGTTREHAHRLVAPLPQSAYVIPLELAAKDDASALRFGDQIALGWTTTCAAIAHRPAPVIASAGSRELWHGWLRAVRREPRVAPAPDTAPLGELSIGGMRIG